VQAARFFVFAGRGDARVARQTRGGVHARRTGPVNGFCFYVKNSAVVELNLSVDRALQTIVSMGVASVKRNPSPNRPGI
jgi:hypothetical protein